MNGLGTRLLPYCLAFFSSLCIMILELVAGRLVARHVGSSLVVWNSVIGIMLGGICLGNVLGGRLADRVEPGRAVGPLYALGAALTLGCLWVNSLGGMLASYTAIPSLLRTISLVSLDFLIPGTLLGMIGPVVAKMAIEQAKKTGSAIGDVYFLGAVGSIVGTFLAGFILIYYAPVSVIVTIVAAALALLAGLLMKDVVALILGTTAAIALGIGSGLEMYKPEMLGGISVGGVQINYAMLVGHVIALLFGILGIVRLFQARNASIADEPKEMLESPVEIQKTKLGDLAVLSFIVSMAFMAFEMAASRFVTHHLGSSIYGWTSVIGVLLGGLSIGNFLGGAVANHIKSEKGASWLFLFASVAVLSVLLLESPPKWLCYNPIGWLFKGQEADRIFASGGSVLSVPVYHLTSFSWWARVLIVVTGAFFLPSLTLGTVSPVVAKLAVDRLRASKRTGTAIGQIYAWGMVGSILGTFLTGFVLIDIIGTKGVILLIAVMLALSATMLGSIWHAAWAGVPLGLCVIAFVPIPALEKRGIDWGIREERGDPSTDKSEEAWVDESNYYFIKVGNQQVALGKKRTIVLDNLEHGYFTLGHPEQLDYEYEHIYALVADRVARARAKEKKTDKLDGLGMKTLFFGGGAYTFPRYLQSKYPGTLADVAEIDPAILKANKMALGLGSVPSDNDITTHLGDARAFVDRHQSNEYDLVFGDAFNDFSVPWHLTTKEFNDKVSKMIGDKGVYMINIIDAYESEAKIKERVETKIKALKDPTEAQKQKIERDERWKAERFTGFLGAWAETARKTFKHVYVYGTSETPGNGQRETFVVVVSNSPIDIENLGSRDNDPQFFSKSSDRLFEPKPFNQEHLDAVAKHSRGIILTDDYAPVENLLAPVAETRGHED